MNQRDPYGKRGYRNPKYCIHNKNGICDYYNCKCNFTRKDAHICTAYDK